MARPVLIATLAERSSSKYLPCRLGMLIGDAWYGVELRAAYGWRAAGVRPACAGRAGGGVVSSGMASGEADIVGMPSG